MVVAKLLDLEHENYQTDLLQELVGIETVGKCKLASGGGNGDGCGEWLMITGKEVVNQSVSGRMKTEQNVTKSGIFRAILQTSLIMYN